MDASLLFKSNLVSAAPEAKAANISAIQMIGHFSFYSTSTSLSHISTKQLYVLLYGRLLHFVFVMDQTCCQGNHHNTVTFSN